MTCIIRVVAILSTLAVATSTFAAGPVKPNIIFILADDLGIPGIGCYGGAFKTPQIDALAAGGTRFEYCFAAPLCAPSRSLCMFGRYAFRTGVLDNGRGAAATPDNEVCVAKVLKQAGYATAVAGKWRQLSHFNTQEDGRRWGWDEFIIWGAGKGEGGEGEGKGNGEGKGDRYWDPAYNLNGRRLPDAEGKYGPDVLQEFVVDFIRRHRQQPFFIYYPMPLIHSPILPTPDSKTKEKGKGKKDGGGLYADNIAYVDKLVGNLVAELDRQGLRQQTLVVFTGDNGSVGKNTINGQVIDGGKHTMQEGGSRVPLITNWKGVTPAGRVLPDLVDFSDFYATFTELAGARLPEGVTYDSHSFAPQLNGQPGQPREWAYVQLDNNYYVREPRWKLNQQGQLFDMKEAPFREIPVAADSPDPESQAARQRLQAVLDKLSPNTGKNAADKAGKAGKADKAGKAKRKKRSSV